MPTLQPLRTADDAWYRRIVESATQYAIFSTDLENKIVTWNPGAEALFGYSTAEAVGRDARLIFTPEDICAFEPEKEIANTVERTYATDERWHRRKDGSWFWASGLMMLLVDDNRVRQGFVKIVRDRTEQRKLREAVRLAEERYRLVNRATTEVIWDWDIPADVLSWNEAVLTHFGYEPKELTPSLHGWADHIHPEDRARVLAAIEAEIAGSAEIWSAKYRFLRKNGEVADVFDRAVIARDSNGRAYRMVGSMLDMTEDRRAEGILREAQEKLTNYAHELEKRVAERTRRLTETLEALETFSYSAAHDLRTPLRTIIGFAEILRGELAENDTANIDDYLNRIHRAASRMDQLLQDLLRYGRATRAAVELEQVELAGIVTNAVENVRQASSARNARIEVISPLPPVMAHPGTLQLVITNLLENAVRFVAPGVIPWVRISSEEHAGLVRLWVEDNGVGIRPEHHDRVYRLFERLHPAAAYPGTGVGLALVKQAMQRLGGATGFESEPGKGSRFWIELPKAH